MDQWALVEGGDACIGDEETSGEDEFHGVLDGEGGIGDFFGIDNEEQSGGGVWRGGDEDRSESLA